MMKYIDIRLEFDEEIEDDYTYYELARVRPLESTVPEGSLIGICESLAQSDFGQIEMPNAIIEAIEGNTTTF